MMREERFEMVEDLYLTMIGELAERAQIPQNDTLMQYAAEYQAQLAEIDRARAELDAMLEEDADECEPLQRLMGGYEALAKWAFETGYRYGTRAPGGAVIDEA